MVNTQSKISGGLWPAQIKAVVDRFYSHTMELTSMHKKTVMRTLAWNDDEETFADTKAYYDKICDYMQFENFGTVIGKGCGTPSMTAGTDYPKMAIILAIADDMIAKTTVPCTSCHYCVSKCPKKLDIPFLLKLYNEVKKFAVKMGR